MKKASKTKTETTENKYEFVTKNSNDITKELLDIAEKNIDRTIGMAKLNKYVSKKIAEEIEKGIFEFSLIHIVINKLENSIVSNIYYDKVEDICCNIDIKNTHINNTTLIDLVKSNTFKPFFVAFMSPEQLHPIRWKNLVEKLKIKEDTINNISSTDIYQCKKCKENKTKVSRLQLRGADEPESLFIVCLVCYHTFIK
jgi:DNA-directed RNA polymerase subunit M/transcription elongation factor TFIIS